MGTREPTTDGWWTQIGADDNVAWCGTTNRESRLNIAR
jgi:hypothetical protein